MTQIIVVVSLAVTATIGYRASLFIIDNRQIERSLTELESRPEAYDYNETEILSPEFYDVITERGQLGTGKSVVLIIPSPSEPTRDVALWLSALERNGNSELELWIASVASDRPFELPIDNTHAPLRVLSVRDPIHYSRRSGIQIVPVAIVVTASRQIKAVLVGSVGREVIETAISLGIREPKSRGGRIFRGRGGERLVPYSTE